MMANMMRQSKLDGWLVRSKRRSKEQLREDSGLTGNTENRPNGGQPARRGPGSSATHPSVGALRILQCNMNNCKATHDLMSQKLVELGIDIAIISEPYLKKGGGRWAVSRNGQTAIWVKIPQEADVVQPTNEGIVGVTLGDITFLSTYFSGNAPEEAYKRYLEELGNIIRGRKLTIVAGDLNAKSVLWGESGGKETAEKERVAATEAFIAQHELIVANQGRVATCIRHNGTSIVDVTLTTEDVDISDWRVLLEENFSDHRYIAFNVNTGTGTSAVSKPRLEPEGWVLKKEAVPELERALKADLERMTPANDILAEQAVIDYVAVITRTCNDVLPRRRTQTRKRVYWWNGDIGEKKIACEEVRRRLKRLSDPDRTGAVGARLLAELRHKRKELRIAIAQSKSKKWDELIQELDRDPWSKAYRIVQGKYGKIPDIATSDNDAVVKELFPRDEDDWYSASADVGEINDETSPFTPEEMDLAIGSLAKKRKKAPGPDNVVGEIVKACYAANPVKMLDLYNRCLEQRVFPKVWKRGRLALIPKPNSTKKRPITMLDTLGKVYETLINNRIKNELKENGSLSELQFGFREGKSTAGALQVLKRKIRGARSRGKFGVVVSFDIKNAFNTIKWSSILNGLQKAGVSGYLQRLVREYGAERVLLYTSNGEKKEYLCNRGVPQGSVLGPTLWIIAYNTILQLGRSDDETVLGFADDTLLIVTGDNPYSVEGITNSTIERIRKAVEDLGCSFAPEKTVALFISPKRTVKSDCIEVQVNGVPVTFCRSMKYLGVMVDAKLSFEDHVEYASAKAKRVVGKLAGITKNLKGPKEKKRKLYSTIVNQVLLYGSSVWSTELSTKSKAKLNSAQRIANIRQIQGYITVSGDSAGALAGNPPADLLADEASVIEERVGRLAEQALSRMERRVAIKQLKLKARAETLERWNHRWQNETNPNSWTRKLCGDLQNVDRRNIQNTFRTSQLLTGKGVFNKYRCDLKKTETAQCWYCPSQEDTAEHTMFGCPKWEEERRKLTEVTPEFFPGEQLLAALSSSKESWKAFQAFAETVMTSKEEEERRVEALAREERRRAQAVRCSVM